MTGTLPGTPQRDFSLQTGVDGRWTVIEVRKKFCHSKNVMGNIIIVKIKTTFEPPVFVPQCPCSISVQNNPRTKNPTNKKQNELFSLQTPLHTSEVPHPLLLQMLSGCEMLLNQREEQHRNTAAVKREDRLVGNGLELNELIVANPE